MASLPVKSMPVRVPAKSEPLQPRISASTTVRLDESLLNEPRFCAQTGVLLNPQPHAHAGPAPQTLQGMTAAGMIPLSELQHLLQMGLAHAEDVATTGASHQHAGSITPAFLSGLQNLAGHVSAMQGGYSSRFPTPPKLSLAASSGPNVTATADSNAILVGPSDESPATEANRTPLGLCLSSAGSPLGFYMANGWHQYNPTPLPLMSEISGPDPAARNATPDERRPGR